MQFLHQDFRVEQFVDPGFSKGLPAAALILFAAAVRVCVALPQLVWAVGVTALVLGHAARCGPFRAVARVNV